MRLKLPEWKIFRLSRWLAPYMRTSSGKLAMVLVSAVVLGAVSTVDLFLIRYFLDHLVNQPKLSTLLVGFLIYGAAIMTTGLAERVHLVIASQVNSEMMVRIKEDLFKKYQTLSLSFFQDSRAGRLIHQMNNQVLVVQFGISGLLFLIREVAVIIALTSAAFALNATYTLVALAVIPLATLFRDQRFKHLFSLFRSQQNIQMSLDQILLERIRGLRIIRIFQGEEREQNRFRSELFRWRDHFMECNRLEGSIVFNHVFVKLIGVGVVFFLYGKDVLEGRATAGSFIAFVLAVSAMYGPIGSLFSQYSRVLQMYSSGEELFRVLEAPSTVPDDGKEPLAGPPTILEFRNIGFHYVNTEETAATSPVLKDISFSIRSGEVAAVLGPNGAGKSTLLNLIPRFYDPIAGSIHLNGKDIRELSLNELRSQISMVAQETFLFDDTIYNNIAYSRPGATREQIIQASQRASAHSFISELASGYETQVGEGGSRLSEGQKQRIAIARAFLKDSPIVLMDEPTSALDAASHQSIMTVLNDLMKNRIVLVVTHRTNDLPEQVRLLKIENGKLSERSVIQDVPAARAA